MHSCTNDDESWAALNKLEHSEEFLRLARNIFSTESTSCRSTSSSLIVPPRLESKANIGALNMILGASIAKAAEDIRVKRIKSTDSQSRQQETTNGSG